MSPLVLVDTGIWSLALRRSSQERALEEGRQVEEWGRLVTSGRALLVGPVQQEVLSGIREPKDFDSLHGILAAFPYLAVVSSDFVQAARFFNRCRAKGVAGSQTDMLICAVASRADVPIFTADRDFLRYSEHVPIRLHEPG